ncbi:hypothetical protein C8R47DRAFT_480311 [Mycena vitilis]|nr:hypothetical protein C8R47DRAFT_480311 [Mycena vitilis]
MARPARCFLFSFCPAPSAAALPSSLFLSSPSSVPRHNSRASLDTSPPRCAKLPGGGTGGLHRVKVLWSWSGSSIRLRHQIWRWRLNRTATRASSNGGQIQLLAN